MPLKTDYKNFIPSTTTKIHDIKQASDGTVINADVILEDVTIYSQEGDAFGSADINATNAQVNANTDDIDVHKAESASKHITESGSNANGSYIKFDDGTMICNKLGTMVYLSAWSLQYIWVFPASFISPPNIISTFKGDSVVLSTESLMTIAQLSSADIGITQCSVNTSSDGGFISGDVAGVNCLAIGRWK